MTITSTELCIYIKNNPYKLVKLLQTVGSLPLTNTVNLQLQQVPEQKFDSKNVPLDIDYTETVVTFRCRILPNVCNESSFVLSDIDSLDNYLSCSDMTDEIYTNFKSMLDL